MPTLELETLIDHRHEIHLRLPTEAKPGPAKILVSYETVEPQPQAGNLDHFLDSLPRNAGGRDRSDILNQILEERGAWEDGA